MEVVQRIRHKLETGELTKEEIDKAIMVRPMPILKSNVLRCICYTVFNNNNYFPTILVSSFC